MSVDLSKPVDDEGIHRWVEPIVYGANRLCNCGIVLPLKALADCSQSSFSRQLQSAPCPWRGMQLPDGDQVS